ncbi:hypothetical protein [Falsirhodobacter sp. 1013]|uniref:hypothetical protein n=1 Tax=Falsirhodobacter sp. 1013 TaxID=3417566 RepID=UPI003EBDF755
METHAHTASFTKHFYLVRHATLAHYTLIGWARHRMPNGPCRDDDHERASRGLIEKIAEVQEQAKSEDFVQTARTAS